MKILQVLGTNGSGKSTALRELAASDPGSTLYVDVDAPRPGQYISTAVPRYHGVLVGNYLDDAKTPGGDRIGSKARLLSALDYATALASALGMRAVAWEGIILMTRQYLPEYQARRLDPVFYLLDTPLEECYRRLEHRSGKPRSALKQNGKIVADRYAAAQRLADWLGQQPGVQVVSGPGDLGSVASLLEAS